MARTNAPPCGVPEPVATMLSHLDLEPGMRVLEVVGPGGRPIGAILCEACGARSVDTVRVDENLDRRSARYDRVLVTSPVVAVSYDWLRVLRRGGVVLVPWWNHFAGAALVRLTVDDERGAGAFLGLLDGLGQPWPPTPSVEDVHGGVLDAGEPTACDLDVALWEDTNALFALGLRLPDVRVTWADEGHRRRGWLFDDSAWAAVTWDEGDAVWEQYGLRKLWPVVEKAYRWWEANDRPEPHRFGMTVASFGQFAWLGDRYSGRIWRL
ncbi:hypothetical protein DFJ64_3038 [Thermasporomyces composti]|uniref:Protein-L-isoaspartate O-methyltransferase n=1 Tax=Thermasporomyces composti TaxID=696763 RepID=A0A3D9VHC5_THECX|nr:hypothetical protein DFJ64_3038 [Thermasporomyces composti]